MKKILMFLIVGMFMISLASAAEFDNAISDYNEDEEIITFKNGCIFDIGWTCLGSEIGRVQLKTPRNFKVAPGYNYVWEMDAWVEDDYNDFLKGFEFEDMNNNKQKINRDIDIKMLSYEEVEVNDYELSCEEVNNPSNESITEECENVIIGTHNETKEVWTKVTPANIKKSDGKITLRGYTNVQVGDYIDWSPMIFGVRVSHDIWASWVSSMNVNLISYYKLDGTPNPVIDSVGYSNGTNNGAGSGSTGIIGNAYNFDPVPDWVDTGVGTGGEITNTPFSVSLWVKPDNISAQKRLWGDRELSGSNYQVLYYNASGVVVYEAGPGLGSVLMFGGQLTQGVWSNIVLTFDTNDVRLYVNGINVVNATSSALRSVTPERNIVFGRWYVGYNFNFYDGLIDEFAIWNRTLTSNEVKDIIWNNGLGNTFTDDFQIEITLNNPPHNFVSSDLDIDFNATIEANGPEIVNVSLLIDGVINQTNTSGTTGNYTFEQTLPAGTYNWSISVIDNETNTTSSNTRTLIIDIGVPQTLVESPTGTLDYNYVGANETLNVTFTDDNLDACWYNYNGTNITIDGCLTGVKNSTLFILEDKLNMTIYANDTSGNLNTTFLTWNYNVFELATISDASILITQTGNYNLHFRSNGSSLTNQKLVFNGVNNSAALTNNGDGTYNITATRTAIETDPASSSFNFAINVASTTTTRTINQTIIDIVLTNCSDGNSSSYIHLIFKDEGNLSSLNASVSSSIWSYWIDDEDLAKTFLFTSLTEQPSYDFCFAPPTKTYTLNIEFPFSSTNYPQRIFRANDIVLTNTTTNRTLYLLSSSDGFFTRYAAINSLTGSAIEGVEVTVQKSISGAPTTVAQGITDDTGLITLWLNPDDLHSYTFTKEGFQVSSFNIRPSSPDTYQIAMVPTSTSNVGNGTNIGTGLAYEILPVGTSLEPNTTHTFSFSVNRTGDVDSFNMTLSANGTIFFTGSNVGNGIISTGVDVLNNDSILGKYIINLGNETMALQKSWTVINITQGEYSLDAWFDYANALNINSLWWSLFKYVFMMSLLLMVAYGFYYVDPFDSSVSSLIAAIVIVWLFGTFGWLTINTPGPTAIDNTIIPALFSFIMIAFMAWRYKSQ